MDVSLDDVQIEDRVRQLFQLPRTIDWSELSKLPDSDLLALADREAAKLFYALSFCMDVYANTQQLRNEYSARRDSLQKKLKETESKYRQEVEQVLDGMKVIQHRETYIPAGLSG